MEPFKRTWKERRATSHILDISPLLLSFLYHLFFSPIYLHLPVSVSLSSNDSKSLRLGSKAPKSPPLFHLRSLQTLISLIAVFFADFWVFQTVDLCFQIEAVLYFSWCRVVGRFHQPMAGRSWLFSDIVAVSPQSFICKGMDFSTSGNKPQLLVKILVATLLTAVFIFILKQSPGFSGASVFANHDAEWTHVLVTGGAGYIGSHATLRLLKDSYRVTIVDNLSRGNIGAVKVLQKLFPMPGRLQFIYADLGDAEVVDKIFAQNKFDAVMHFAAVAYVGESTLEPLRYYHNITSNTLVILEAMAKHGVKTLIYSSTCATYGEPEKMPITENTPQSPINPYGKAKKMAEDMILDFSKTRDMAVMILRYFNVIGSDPEGRLGEFPRPELREHGRISGACFDAAQGIITGLKVKGTDYATRDGTCIRDYIDVTDLVDAHVKALDKARPKNVGIYNVGTGRGRSVKEFVEACKKATGVDIKVDYLERRPGDYAEVYSDPSKINEELNWTAKHTNLEQSLRIAWRWQKSHRNGYETSFKIQS